jgi:hypothetical protein
MSRCARFTICRKGPKPMVSRRGQPGFVSTRTAGRNYAEANFPAENLEVVGVESGLRVFVTSCQLGNCITGQASPVV